MDNRGKRYRAKWSGFNWFFTLLISFLAFVLVPARIWHSVSQHGLDGYAYLLGLVPAILLLAALFAPVGYAVTPTEVRIKRVGPNVIIPMSDIQAIRRIGREDLGVSIRAGVGGFLGTYGALVTSRMGLVAAYITNSHSLVLIERREGRKVLISPDEPSDFVDRVQDATATPVV